MLALQLARVRLAKQVLLAAIAWFYLCASGAIGIWLMASLERDYPPLAAEDFPAADVIVLLGGAVHHRAAGASLGNLNRWSDRLVFTTALYRAGKAPKVLISGGGERDRPTEAELTRDILLVMGIPEHAIILEQDSRTTFDNARYTIPMLKQRGWREVLLVTSAFHMPRANQLFSNQGLNVYPAATDHQVQTDHGRLLQWLPTLGGLELTTYALHEYIGYFVYRLQGRF